MVRFLRLLFFLFVWVLAICSGFSQNPYILRNINESSSLSSMGGPANYQGVSEADNFLELNGKSYFFAFDPVYGNELHQTDGTAAGTYLLRDINAGPEGVSCDGWLKVGNRLFFHLSLGAGAYSLWCTDGTEAGTVKLLDHSSSYFSWVERNNTGMAGHYYFLIRQTSSPDPATPTTLYRTDGTPEGTVPYFSASTGIASLTNFNNKLFFAASTDPLTQDWKIWSGDGFNPPLVFYDFTPQNGASIPDVMENINEQYLLVATHYQDQAGTLRYGLFRVDADAAIPAFIADFAGRIYNFLNNNLDRPAVIGNRFFFCGSTDNGYDEPPWVTDGTPAGTFQMLLNSGASGAVYPSFAGMIGNDLYLNATPASGNECVWKWDGLTDRPTLLYPSSFITNIFRLNDKLFAFGSLGNSLGTFNAHLTSLDGSRTYLLFDPTKFEQAAGHNGQAVYQGKILGIFRPHFWDAGWEPYLLEPDFKTWTGEASNQWQDGNNWWPAGTPTAADNVLVPQSATYPVISIPATCRNLYLNFGTVTISGGATLQVANDLANMGELKGEGTVVMANSDPAKLAGQGLFSVASLIVKGQHLQVVEGLKNFSGTIDFQASARIMNPTNWLRLHATARLTNAGSTAFIEGPLIRQTVAADSLVFPVGKNGLFRPVTIRPAGDAGEYTAEFFNASPQAIFGADVQDPLLGITNAASYWQVSKTAGSAPARLTFPLREAIPNVPEENLLMMGRWNGSAWQPLDITPGATTNAGSGSFTTPVLDSFSPFAFGWGQAPLPLTLLSFRAGKEKQAVHVTWQTVQEVNTSHFDIERSGDGFIFYKIGAVGAERKQNYAFHDREPLKNVAYYRLKMVDLDGSYSYSGMVALEADAASTGFEVFPNPTREQLFIRYPGVKETARVRIYELGGRLLRQQEVVLEQGQLRTIQLDGLKSGSYLLVVILHKETRRALFFKQ